MTLYKNENEQTWNKESLKKNLKKSLAPPKNNKEGEVGKEWLYTFLLTSHSHKCWK